jgi:hypothetical protein
MIESTILKTVNIEFYIENHYGLSQKSFDEMVLDRVAWNGVGQINQHFFL